MEKWKDFRNCPAAPHLLTVHQYLRFFFWGQQSILVLFEQVKMDEDEVLVNVYPICTRSGWLT